MASVTANHHAAATTTTLRSDLSEPAVSIVVPTLDEAANLLVLMRRISAAMSGVSYEVLLIDDGSRDDTVEVCAELKRTYPLELYVRHAARGGLSGAVLFGFNLARAATLVVMDADLQHPPEFLPVLIGPIINDEADFVVASRYMAGGSTMEDWGPVRRSISRIATTLARPLAPTVHDPMSGFFALRRQLWLEAQPALNPLGYKIALELMCKCAKCRTREIPYHFDTRHGGKSKLSLFHTLAFMWHLARLYTFHCRRCAARSTAVVLHSRRHNPRVSSFRT